jgi:hypothetical protein
MALLLILQLPDMTTAPELDLRARRTLLERIADSDSDLAASSVFVVAHLLCFAVWILVEYTPTGNPRSLRFQFLERAILYRDKGKYCGQQHV